MRYRLMAAYHGIPYEAGVGPTDTDVTLFADSPPPAEHGFEDTGAYWRKLVGRGELDAIWESRPIGRYRSHPCLVLEDIGDRLHITHLGHDSYQAERLGYWQVDRGVYEVVVPYEDVTDLAEERVDYPARGMRDGLLHGLPRDGLPRDGLPPAREDRVRGFDGMRELDHLPGTNGTSPPDRFPAPNDPARDAYPAPPDLPSAEPGQRPGAQGPRRAAKAQRPGPANSDALSGPMPRDEPGRGPWASPATSGSAPPPMPKRRPGQPTAGEPSSGFAPLAPAQPPAQAAAGPPAPLPAVPPSAVPSATPPPLTGPTQADPEPAGPARAPAGPGAAFPADAAPGGPALAGLPLDGPPPARPATAAMPSAIFAPRSPSPGDVVEAGSVLATLPPPTGYPHAGSPLEGPPPAGHSQAGALLEAPFPATAVPAGPVQARSPLEGPPPTGHSQAGALLEAPFPAEAGPPATTAAAGPPGDGPLLATTTVAAFPQADAGRGADQTAPIPGGAAPTGQSPAGGAQAGPDLMLPASVAPAVRAVADPAAIASPLLQLTPATSPPVLPTPGPPAPGPPAQGPPTSLAPAPSAHALERTSGPAVPAQPPASAPQEQPARPLPAGVPGTAAEAGPAYQAGTSPAGEEGGAPQGGRRRRTRVETRWVFKDLVDMAAITHTSYAVDEEIDGALCLIKTDDGYEVFHAIDGAKHEVRFFDDEESAYFYLFGVLAAEAVRGGRLVPRPD